MSSQDYLDNEITRLQTKVDELEKVRVCSVCAGNDNPVSNLPCICGGIGTQEAELQGAHEYIYSLHQERDTLQESEAALKVRAASIESATIERCTKSLDNASAFSVDVGEFMSEWVITKEDAVDSIRNMPRLQERTNEN